MENLKHFEALYQCRIEPTGETLYKAPNVRESNIPLTLMEKIFMEKEREIAIKMPESEYVKFVANWNQYMDILLTSNKNPEIREQFQQLMLLVHMLK